MFASQEEADKHIKTPEDRQRLYEEYLGKLNEDGKLDQVGQKDSMRAKWKAQFPKSKRAPDAIGFKNFSDERFLNIVEAVYVPALEKYVDALETKAKTIDKGHQPTHLLKQAHQQLERMTKARDERAKRVEAAQKKKREAKVNKKRSKAAARGAKLPGPRWCWPR